MPNSMKRLEGKTDFGGLNSFGFPLSSLSFSVSPSFPYIVLCLPRVQGEACISLFFPRKFVFDD